ncbi:MAG: ubiquinone/menaquinone biosynthesis methyltransferase [Terriglobales bacterium]|jgi:demethylmenaquinone methyltransferase/2-methoxy-6-polyprenyl-1,4-benzoquinol methylase
MKQRQTNVTGAQPLDLAGQDERAQAAAVREMFTSIAPRYDFLNHFLSLRVDTLWWQRTARTFTHILRAGKARVLDLCCGTGDMSFALLRESRRGNSGSASVVGVDFSHAMLVRALSKTNEASDVRAMAWIEADALSLPFGPSTFQLVTSAFGFRNLVNYDAGLREIYRVLAPGGEVGILDFGEPDGMIGQLYRLYFRYGLPAIGSVLSGVRGPYAYLPASVHRFPRPEQMLERLRSAGFREASWTPYTFGIAGLYRGIRPE